MMKPSRKHVDVFESASVQAPSSTEDSVVASGVTLSFEAEGHRRPDGRVVIVDHPTAAQAPVASPWTAFAEHQIKHHPGETWASLARVDAVVASDAAVRWMERLCWAPSQRQSTCQQLADMEEILAAWDHRTMAATLAAELDTLDQSLEKLEQHVRRQVPHASVSRSLHCASAILNDFLVCTPLLRDVESNVACLRSLSSTAQELLSSQTSHDAASTLNCALKTRQRLAALEDAIRSAEHCYENFERSTIRAINQLVAHGEVSPSGE